MTQPTHSTSAFTLVELSIVLVIIGLIVGGVLQGQSLIRSAELQSVSAQIDSFQSATNTFRSRYHGLPGDLDNATKIWGAAADCTAAVDTGKATCDGDGNGIVRWGGAQKNRAEFFTYWQQLSNAELIKGTFNGVIRNPAQYHAGTEPGVNAPVSAIDNGCVNFKWGLADQIRQFRSGAFHVFVVGVPSVTPSGGQAGWVDYCHMPIFTAEDAYRIDAKQDDGRPASGSVRAFKPPRNASCVTDNTLNSEYQIMNKDITCALTFGFNK